jgi:hypothetical protein
MDDNLKKIIQGSTFKVIDGDFAYVKVASIPSGRYFMVTTDNDEITVITETSRLSELNILERNKDIYGLIALNVSVPFYSVGFLAAVSNAVAESGMNILIVSTYSKDYILIRKDKLYECRKILFTLGFQEKT